MQKRRQNKRPTDSSNHTVKTHKLELILWMFLLFFPTHSSGEVFQWTDARGTIHLTDNPQSIPDSLRGSPSLIIRHDLEVKGSVSGSLDQPSTVNDQPAPPEPDAASPPDPPQKKAAPPNVQDYSQHITIVVINSVVHQIRKHPCLNPAGCQGVFRPNFDDRRFIHPSVFNGGSRQFVQPELFPSTRK